MDSAPSINVRATQTPAVVEDLYIHVNFEQDLWFSKTINSQKNDSHMIFATKYAFEIMAKSA